MVTVDRETGRLVELLIGATAIGSFLIEVYVYPLYTSNIASLVFTVILPIIFAATVITGVVHEGYAIPNVIAGCVGTFTLLVGLWSLYGYYSAEGGVFFGGLITILVSFGLFACVLGREIWYRWPGRGTISSENTTGRV